ncbi:MAG: di-heme-cytochrome C peroxidase [Methylophilaceae bacterium]
MKYLKQTILLTTLIGALALVTQAVVANKSQKVTYLEQNWTEKDREYFYFADQGSRLVPYGYFLHLEQENSTALFRSDANMKRMGLIPASKSKNNPDALPIGLTRNGDYMGPTCAACHTQQITYQNETIHIDGGQAFFHLNQFLMDITASLKVTLDNAEKFDRFQQRILGDKASDKQKSVLKEGLQASYKKRFEHMQRNHSDVPSGYTRLDAFGAILNQALLATEVEDNRNALTAPTSIPYIWDTPQHDYVEWNGSQSNTGVGALARNIGEVIGVFGEVETETTHWLGLVDGGYPSSIQTSELRKLEHVVSTLHSPLWPESFPQIDAELASQGRGLYEQHCVQCHLDIDRTNPKRLIQVRMSTVDEIKTDPLMAENAIDFRGKSGKFEGRPKYYFAGKPLGAEAPAIDIANNIMVGVIKNNPLQAYLAKRDAKKLGHPNVTRPPKYVDGKIVEKGQEVSRASLLAYKARPLNGVWTSAPFLHNGSVPNLYQLLLPTKDRDQHFHLGSWEFDPKNVGYVLGAGDNDFVFDTTLPGNSNAGHEYGTGAYGKPALTEEQRWALVEYLKTL